LASSDDDDSDTENNYDSENDSDVPTLNMTDDERGSENECRDEYDGEDIVGEVEVKKDVWALMNDRNENMRECDDGMRSIVVDNGCTRTLVGDLRRLSGSLRVKATKVRVRMSLYYFYVTILLLCHWMSLRMSLLYSKRCREVVWMSLDVTGCHSGCRFSTPKDVAK
jgi:hypothetical protein